VIATSRNCDRQHFRTRCSRPRFALVVVIKLSAFRGRSLKLEGLFNIPVLISLSLFLFFPHGESREYKAFCNLQVKPSPIMLNDRVFILSSVVRSLLSYWRDGLAALIRQMYRAIASRGRARKSAKGVKGVCIHPHVHDCSCWLSGARQFLEILLVIYDQVGKRDRKRREREK